MKVQDVTELYLNGALPGKGALIFAAGYQKKNHRNEIEMGNWVHNVLGGDIIFLTESDVRNVKMPDYKWKNRLWELKGATSINGADKSLQKAIKQIQNNPGGVILNLQNDVDMELLEKQLFNRVHRSLIGDLDIMILRKKKLVKVLRYKK